MSSAVRHPVPDAQRDLIANLRASDEAKGKPELSAEKVEVAREWLARVLVDSRALFAHLDLLQALYGAKFRVPLPRYYRVEGVAPPPAEPPPGFRHNQPLPDEKALAVAERGPGALSPDDLAALLLNPLALWDLADRINFTRPDYWLPRMEAVGRELMERDGMRVPIPGLDEGLAPGTK